MVYTVEKALVLAKRAMSKLQSIYDLALQVREDESLQSEFIAAFENASLIFSEFQSTFRDTLFDESSDAWNDLSKLDIQIDGTFYKIKAIHLSLGKPQSRASSPALSMVSDSQPNKSHIRLPRIELPKFDGCLKDWPTFKDLFNTLIHENQSLSDVEKFQYLISTLSKEPLTLVKHLPLTSNNYQIAHRTLVDRYQSSRVLATFYWNNIANAPKMSKQSPQALRNLLNSFVENLAALDQIEDVDHWDFTLFNWLLGKVDPDTRQRFELSHPQPQLHTFDELKQFLSDQCRALEATTSLDSSSSNFEKSRSGHEVKSKNSNSSSRWDNKRSQHSFAATTSQSSPKSSCLYCKDHSHTIGSCPSFSQLTPSDRYTAVKSSRSCLNCLSPQHLVKFCKSRFSCRHCSRRHHSMLHFGETTGDSSQTSHSQEPSQSVVESSEPSVSLTSVRFPTSSSSSTITLLATVRLEIRDRWGNYQTFRALCDPGSQVSFLTENCRNRLGLAYNRSSSSIACLGNTSVRVSRGNANCTLRPVGSSTVSLCVNAIIIGRICSKLPHTQIDSGTRYSNVNLADPSWNIPGNIDLLLGADVFPQVVRGSVFHFADADGNLDGPAAMDTIFGIALVGPISCNAETQSQPHSFFVSLEPSLDDILKSFWKVEEVPTNTCVLSSEEQLAENSFVETHTRDHSGRFVVSLPFKDTRSLPIFVGSQEIAHRRFLALERRLNSSPIMRDKYNEFMQDYLDSGHMSLVPSSEMVSSRSYYVPHHCIFKENDPHKIRVVFDASAKDSVGISLNETLLPGPKLQSDIGTMLIRFRWFSFAFTCDIRQMFRQILVGDSHREFQLIVWRFSMDETIETYRLNTVTYGYASSPFLAIRCLLQLAQEGHEHYPLAAQAILSNLYVEDFACGADTLESLLELQRQLIELLNYGCYELRKWSSNSPSLLASLPSEYCQNHPFVFENDKSVGSKILGLQWHSSLDSFSFAVKPLGVLCTKRAILSEVARIYDPLGFLCPLTFFAKRLIQHLWLLGLDWDAEPPEDVRSQWEKYRSSLASLSNLKIPRCSKPTSFVDCSLHAFCDASEVGYAAVVYLRFVEDDRVFVSFVIAKSKVAPLKRLSIPRLELLAAVLLSNLVSFVLKAYSNLIEITRVVAWSDSKVALFWIRSAPYKWKTFVANRVAHIQERIPPDCWRHVRSWDNPADPASRGLLPEELLNCSLWWAGPAWLSEAEYCWSRENSDSSVQHADCERRYVTFVAQLVRNDLLVLLDRFSSLGKIQRILAFCIRFVDGCRRRARASNALTRHDLHHALCRLVRIVQLECFHSEIAIISKGQLCSKTFQRLSPFIDSEGILRVGGRLSNASLLYDTRHPALLPGKHRLTQLIIEQVHLDNKHSGVNTTLYLTQQNFWIVSARRAIRRVLSLCHSCFRTKPTAFELPMADLPTARVSQLKAFSCVGVDYGGPFPIHISRRRGSRPSKAYLCLFVCFATKALHLEIASDLSSDTFLAALRRFIARRGRCSRIFSDCGTNFVGANKELVAQFKLAVESEAIEWCFNPPSAPHFGGLWESGIKSVKTHITRVIGKQILTYEELNTLVAQIEAVLNSRPLCSLSSDPNDLGVLTPGHFLTLEPLTAPPDVDLTQLNLSRLSRWQLVQRLQQDFWQRWRDEYLHTLYQRGKWSKCRAFEPLDIGTLVLIKDDLAPPLHWRLGRIIKLHPGKDKIPRVATVRTTNGLFKRPLVKLCALPLQ